MHHRNSYPRILAVDPRARRFGFAVLEGPRHLLEWGVRSCRGKSAVDLVVQKQLAPLFVLFSPSLIVVRQVSRRNGRGHDHQKSVMHAVAHEARRRSVELVGVGKDELHRLFGRGRSVTKRETASQIALLFPEIIWKLPPVRKSWMRERHNMTMFDAVSAGIAYFARFEDVLQDSQNPMLEPPG